MRYWNGALEIASGANDLGREITQRREVSRMIGQDELRQRLRELAEISPQAARVESELQMVEIFRTRQCRRRSWKYLAAVAASLVIAGASYVIWHRHGRSPVAVTESSYASPDFLRFRIHRAMSRWSTQWWCGLISRHRKRARGV
jgi:hypothetical protein